VLAVERYREEKPKGQKDEIVHLKEKKH